MLFLSAVRSNLMLENCMLVSKLRYHVGQLPPERRFCFITDFRLCCQLVCIYDYWKGWHFL